MSCTASNRRSVKRSNAWPRSPSGAPPAGTPLCEKPRHGNAERWSSAPAPPCEAAATAASPASVHLVWRAEMGVEIPAEASCDLPLSPPIPGTPALAAAAAAYRHALEAAVEHAAVTDAAARVSAELAVTRHRLRAVRDRWIPQLETALRTLELALDEYERAELTRTRSPHRTAPLSAPSTQEPL